MDDEIRRELSQYFESYELNTEESCLRLYWACKKAYMTAGKPYGEADRSMMRWVKHGQGTTVN